MKLVVGLGNPGEEYEGTRHNVGFELLWQFKSQMSELKCQNLEFNENKSLLSEVVGVDEVLLARSTTFMNESGKAVSKLVGFYKVGLGDLYVVYDDLDLRLGEYKVILGRGPRDHKGVNSVREELGSDQFWHVRVGVDGREGDNRILGERYVLEKFTEEEGGVLDKVVGEIQKELLVQLK